MVYHLSILLTLMSKILYVGNDLTRKTSYKTSMALICEKLSDEGIEVVRTSNKTNKIVRFIDMVFSVLKHRNSNIVIIDVFSTTNFYYAFLISQLCRLLNITYATVLRGGNLPSRLSNNRVLSKLIFKNSNTNIAPSKYLEKEFLKQGFKTSYIPNTIELSDYTFENKNIDVPKILWVRSFIDIYNPSMAVKVLKKVKAHYPEAILCMIGPFRDDSYPETVALAEEYGIKDSIEFTGVLKKKDWIKKSKDYNVFINTTNIDNTPVSVIEAMALGFVVISTNVGGIPFLIEDGQDGYLVDKDDHDSMSNKIIKLFEKELKITSKEARNKVETFDWLHVKESWLQLISSI